MCLQSLEFAHRINHSPKPKVSFHSKSLDSSIPITKEDMIDREDEFQDQQQGHHPLHGDLLECVLSHVPLIHLLSASHVCSAWRRAALSPSTSLSRSKPWLVLHTQSRRRRRRSSHTTACAYDPSSHEWIRLARTPPPTPARASALLRASHSTLLYSLSPSALSFSNNPFTDTWQTVEGPFVWRTDPIVALVGSHHVVVAGGTCEFEDDPLAVEVYDLTAKRWDTCRSMPSVLRDCASATWLSVAVSECKMYLLEKRSGRFCSLDVRTMTWDVMCDLRPEPSIFFSVIGFSGDRLVLVGLMGNGESSSGGVESVGVWEVNCESYECEEIGRMPNEMVRRMRDWNSGSLMMIGLVMGRGFVYVYNEWNPREVLFCEFGEGVMEWGSVEDCDLVLNDENLMEGLLFTCVRVGMDDLRKAFGPGKQSFSMITRQEGE